MEMRQVFADVLEDMMACDERVCIIDADLARANGTLRLRERFPERAIDVGVAEANMASVAAGLASYGYIPFITSFAPFATRRICDQLAISVAYAKSNVKIVGTDPGIAAELNGGTHMSFEDLAITRAIPGIVVVEPVDNTQLKQAVRAAAAYEGPVYMRFMRKTQPEVFDESYKFDLFTADVLREGRDVTILATGIMAAKAVAAAEVLVKQGCSVELINVHTLKPLDNKTILNSIAKTKNALTLENHSVIGGLYSAICELTARYLPIKIGRIGAEDIFGQAGKFDELAEVYGFTVEEIVKKVSEIINL